MINVQLITRIFCLATNDFVKVSSVNIHAILKGFREHFMAIDIIGFVFSRHKIEINHKCCTKLRCNP
ncbi:hypothetical protein XSR1_20196 [Xenorhabdus szentirmaii DSM 16338]|uniref:Uncharacterized protein n=1 Tax=Xenorhabdus szentirmaii DSM 16338 TaxID=1427518 RepID=W1IXN0_9GAMM|nr:hypothetical protein XSR1_20196 [Xenorhabdus szentirmaii DSM 16338]